MPLIVCPLSQAPAIAGARRPSHLIACEHNPGTPERVIAQRPRQASPTATPNPRLVALADDALGRGGRMDAVVVIGPGNSATEGRPFNPPARF